MLANVPVPSARFPETKHSARSWRRMRSAVGGAFLFLAGLGTGWFIPTLSQLAKGERSRESSSIERVSQDDNWRQVVSEYLSLYTTETLASIPDNAAVREQELSSVGAKTGLTLALQKIALPELSFKRAQLLQYEGKRLGQIAYLDPESGPIALCFIASDLPDSKLQMEQRQGFNVVYWSRGRYSFMLIGRTPARRLQKLASELFEQLT
jgi:hypothetical protein